MNFQKSLVQLGKCRFKCRECTYINILDILPFLTVNKKCNKNMLVTNMAYSRHSPQLSAASTCFHPHTIVWEEVCVENSFSLPLPFLNIVLLAFSFNAAVDSFLRNCLTKCRLQYFRFPAKQGELE